MQLTYNLTYEAIKSRGQFDTILDYLNTNFTQFLHDETTKDTWKYNNIIQVFEEGRLVIHMSYYTKRNRLPHIPVTLKDTLTTIRHLQLHPKSAYKGLIKIAFLPYEMRRLIPVENKVPLGAEHVNGGYTSGLGGTIICFRKEEYRKVLIHETVHCLGLDIKSYPSRYATELKEALHVTEDLLPNEAITEMLTNIIIINEGGPKKIEASYKKQTKWAIFQTAKILHYYGFRDMGEFLGNNTQEAAKLKEESNVVCYYFVRAALYLHIPELMAAYNQSPANIHIIHRLIMSSIRDPRFIKLVNADISRLNTIKTIKTIKNKRTLSLRMMDV